MNVDIIVECGDQTPGVMPLDVASRIRTLLRSDRARAALAAAHVGINWIGQALNVRHLDLESRVRSAGVLEARFNCVENYTDSDFTREWVETAEGTLTLDDGLPTEVELPLEAP